MNFKTYSPQDLRSAIEYEMQKTDDPKIASIMAIKKLKKDPEYYLDEMHKARPTKYIRRTPDGKGGYTYVYKEEKKGDSWLSKLSGIFGFKDRKQVMQKIEKDYKENEIDKKYGVTWDGWKNHLSEYFNNKEKWDNFFTRKKGEKKPSKESKKDDRQKIKKDKKKSPLQLSVMRFIHNLYGEEKKQKKETKKNEDGSKIETNVTLDINQKKEVKAAVKKSEEFFKGKSTENLLQKWKSGDLTGIEGQTFKYQDIMNTFIKGETTFIDEIIMIGDSIEEYISYTPIGKDGKPDKTAGGGMFTKEGFLQKLNAGSLKSTAFSEEPTKEEVKKAEEEVKKKEEKKTEAKDEDIDDNFETMPDPKKNETITKKGKNGSKVTKDRKVSENQKRLIAKEVDESLREEYFNEKPSDIMNIGKDVMGAKRHNFTTYEKVDVSLEELEKDGVAKGYVTRKNLIGNFGLENKDERVANGETDYKVLGSFLVRQYFKKVPHDNASSRKEYMNFVRSIIRYDNETNSMDDLTNGLSQSAKNIFNVTEEDEKQMEESLAVWYGSKSRKIAEIAEVIGEPLAYFLMPFMAGSTTNARAFDIAKHKMKRNPDKKEFDLLASTYFNETIKKESYDQLRIRALGATKAAGVKIKKGDIIKINDKLKEDVYMVMFSIPKGREDYHKRRGEELGALAREYSMYLNMSRTKKEKALPEFNKKYKQNLKSPFDIVKTLGELYHKEKKETHKDLIREVHYPEGTGTVIKAGKNGIHVSFSFSDGKSRTFNINPADLDQESVENIKKTATRTATIKADLYVEKKVERIGGKNFDNMSTLELQKTLSEGAQMKALQYGNSMPDTERKYHTKWTLQSMSDLADILGLPLEQVSARGKLGIAFGARGKGGALAHYEPDTKVINLTRSNGFGSLAHEWGHFADNILSNNMSGMISDSYIYDGNLREVSIDNMPHGAIYNHEERNGRVTKYFYDADETTLYKWKKLSSGENEPTEKSEKISFRFRQAVVDVPSKNKYQNASKIAKKSLESFHLQCDKEIAKAKEAGNVNRIAFYKGLKENKYYNKPTEAFARAFESYIADKLENNGKKNTYLASQKKTLSKDGNVIYPQGEFRKESEKLFDEFFKDIAETNELKKAINALFKNKKILIRKI